MATSHPRPPAPLSTGFASIATILKDEPAREGKETRGKLELVGAENPFASSVGLELGATHDGHKACSRGGDSLNGARGRKRKSEARGAIE